MTTRPMDTSAPLTTRKVALLGIAGALLLALVWYVTMWKPQRDELAEVRERRSAAVEQAAQVQQRVNELIAFQRDEPAKRAQLERLRQAVPDQPSLAEFVLAANDQAKQAGVEFMSITPTKPDAASASTAGPKPVKLGVTVNGGYAQVLDFLDRFNKLPRIVVLDDVNVGGGGDTGRLAVTMNGQMFATALPMPAGAVDAAATAPTTTVQP